jgi:hypothetical protein
MTWTSSTSCETPRRGGRGVGVTRALVFVSILPERRSRGNLADRASLAGACLPQDALGE